MEAVALEAYAKDGIEGALIVAFEPPITQIASTHVLFFFGSDDGQFVRFSIDEEAAFEMTAFLAQYFPYRKEADDD